MLEKRCDKEVHQVQVSRGVRVLYLRRNAVWNKCSVQIIDIDIRFEQTLRRGG